MKAGSILSLVAVAIGFGAATQLGLLTLVPVEGVSYFWPASGFLLAVLMLMPTSRWPAVFLVALPTGVALGVFGAHRSFLASLGYGVADLLEVWPGAYLLLRFRNREPDAVVDFCSVRQVMALVLGTAPLGALLSGALGAAVATNFSVHSGYLAIFRTWAFSVLVSEVVLTPFLVTWARSAQKGFAKGELSESVLIIVFVTLVTVSVLGTSSPLPVLYLPFPIALWAAVRLGTRGAATASLTFAVITIVLARRGITPFPLAATTAARVQWMQGLIATMAVSSLSLAAAIAEHRETASQLRDAEAKHRHIVEEAPIGVVLTGPGGEILHANPTFAKLIGRSAEAIIGHRFEEFTHPDDRGANLDVLRELVRGTRESATFEKRYVHTDGRTVQTNLHIAALRSEDGEFQNTVTIVEDISERRRLESQLTQSQRMEAVGKLAGGVAHDFNNLLTVILAQAYLAGRRVKDESVKQSLADITDAAERGAGLTRQLLAFARKQVVEPKILDLNAVTQNLMNLLRRLITEDIEVRFEPSPNLWPVRIDPSQFEQIVVNLAVNARDAMPNGGVFVMKTANVTVGLGGEGDVGPGDWMVLTLIDTGVGMDEEVQRHAFEPFFTTKERGKGTGLGLATVHGIVLQSGGHITVTSEPGRGASFRVWLPRATEVSETPKRGAVTETVGSETVLVVEDEAPVRRVACEILRGRGYRVLEAGDADSALEIAGKEKRIIDLVVTDVIMPGKSGRALVDALVTSRPEIRVLYTSGYTDDQIARHGVLEPGVVFLQKPYTPADLIEKVRAALA